VTPLAPHGWPWVASYPRPRWLSIGWPLTPAVQFNRFCPGGPLPRSRLCSARGPPEKSLFVWGPDAEMRNVALDWLLSICADQFHGSTYEDSDVRVYLDNCCFNRPFDDQRQTRNRLDAEAKLSIQEHIHRWRNPQTREGCARHHGGRSGRFCPGGEPMTTDTEVRIRGLRALVDALGAVEAERFVTLMLREPFDYTSWQGHLWAGKSVGEISKAAMELRSAAPNKGVEPTPWSARPTLTVRRAMRSV